ncbi:MAG: S41 family peptidase [Candidatus Pseudobacter hemicellulosilyticus]|uniref:S41 family peptidase n=1 Tax=Candidatus Pseudobacter hemicellulosilyticus TaxID=3121375 RepID=A0AAJ6BGW6_9BACT|nr:MAG: S41 family peptidase [Pseudobacter sp.]
MKKLQVWLPLLFAVTLIAGMWIGSGLRKNIPFSRGLFQTTRPSTVQEVVDLVNLRYVDKVNTDSLTEDAIQAMLAHLDPHSIFIPASRLTEINEDLQGNFEGIGVEFFIIGDTVHASSILEDGPSDAAGILPGDRFLKVGDTVVTGNITADRIKKLLRGPGGTKVAISLLRAGKPIQVTVTRGTIPLYSVDAAYLMDNQTGYIHINKFSGTTYEEFMAAMEKLQKEGMKKLVLDLRDNGGGILGEAVDIADEFLDDDKLIVYTQGDKQPKTEFRCKRPGLFETGELVLLLDEGSASASEVLAGALQDWDRASIIGRRSFGKGLVQEQYNLTNGGALRLTVARYYTPLGRNIQKPYDKGRSAYNDELMERFHNGEMLVGDTASTHAGPVYKTKGGRTVYGGGGITPDVFVPYDTATFSPATVNLFNSQLFSRFIYTYYIDNMAYFSQFKTPQALAQGFNKVDEAWEELLNYAQKDAVNLGTIPEKDKVEVKKRIRTWMGRQIWRMEGYYEINNLFDELVKKGLDQLKTPMEQKLK